MKKPFRKLHFFLFLRGADFTWWFMNLTWIDWATRGNLYGVYQWLIGKSVEVNDRYGLTYWKETAGVDLPIK